MYVIRNIIVLVENYKIKNPIVAFDGKTSTVNRQEAQAG